MMDKLKKNMVFYLLLLIDFYIVPWFIKDTGSAMIVMLVIIPLICLITSVFYGIRNGFNFWYILIVAIMLDRKSTRLNSSHPNPSRMPSSA